MVVPLFKQECTYSEFYDLEIIKAQGHLLESNYKNFVSYIFGEHEKSPFKYEFFLSLNKQLTFKQFVLLKQHESELNDSKKSIMIVLDAFENKADVYEKKKYKSAYLTLKNWMN